jgi:hypothetical protein
MCHSKILNRIKLDYFLKFVIHKFNYVMVKSRIMVLSKREKVDADKL